MKELRFIDDNIESASEAARDGHASLSILIEPTSACNLSCKYCYKGQKRNITMSFDVFKKIVTKTIAYVEPLKRPLSFVWHGGEPTLVGAPFYERAFKYIDDLGSGTKITHTLQTNGTLLTDELLDLFAAQKVSLGVSLDGPPHYHDQLRPKHDGGSTHDLVLDGILRAQQRCLDIGILMSITNDNLPHIHEMFDFCRANRFTFGLNPVTADLHSSYIGIGVTPKNYLQACTETFDRWLYQKDFSIQVNPAFGVTRLLLSKNRLSECSMSENCQMHFISIGPEGDIYPCNRFYGSESYKFGNIANGSLEGHLNNPKRLALLARRASNIYQCRDCSIAHYCNGGCMHHAVVHYDNLLAPDHLCTVYKGIVEHAVMRLDEVLKPQSYITANTLCTGGTT